jgi:hypothetical protein
VFRNSIVKLNEAGRGGYKANAVLSVRVLFRQADVIIKEAVLPKTASVIPAVCPAGIFFTRSTFFLPDGSSE